MNTRIAITSLALGIAAVSQAAPFAAFNDYSAIFTRSISAGVQTMTGTGSIGSFSYATGPTSSATISNVLFNLGGTAVNFAPGMPSTVDSTGYLLGGTFSISKGGTTYLTVNFDQADISTGSFKASDGDLSKLTGDPLDNNVTFGGSLFTSGLLSVPANSTKSFTFSLAQLSPPVSGQRTGNFSASGAIAPVPEPTSVAALGIGILAVARRRRRA